MKKWKANSIGLGHAICSSLSSCAVRTICKLFHVGPFCHGGVARLAVGQLNVRTIRPICTMCNELYGEIAKQLDGLLYKNGGPVIGIQLENEYQHCSTPSFSYPGEKPQWTWPNSLFRRITNDNDGKQKTPMPNGMAILKQFALEAGLVVPLCTVTGWGNAATIPDARQCP